jgi:hypothetical protein
MVDVRHIAKRHRIEIRLHLSDDIVPLKKLPYMLQSAFLPAYLAINIEKLRTPRGSHQAPEGSDRKM